VLAVLGGGVLVPLLVAHRHDIGAALALLVTVCPAWLSVAALAEAVSYLTRGGATRAVLRGAAPTVGTAALAAITVVGDAVAYVLPFGFAAGGAVAVGQAHRRGAPRAAAVWGFAVVTLVGVAVLVALGIAAAGVAAVAAGPGALPSSPGLVAVAAVVVVVAAAAAVRRRRTRWVDLRFRPLPTRAVGMRLPVAARLRARWADLRVQPLPARSVGAAAVGMLLSWLADLAVLALAFVALGERPPLAGLVLAYCLGQAASALPFTPGGLAVVEGGLTATLVAFGGCPAGSLTAVLLYRLISHWAVVPVGGLVWLVLRRRAADEFRAAPRSAFAEGSAEGAERCPTRT
jgi:putative heme transporter